MTEAAFGAGKQGGLEFCLRHDDIRAEGIQGSLRYARGEEGSYHTMTFLDDQEVR